MPNEPRLILDAFSEFYHCLKPWAVGEFWNLQNHQFVDDAVYVIERQRFVDAGDKIKQAMQSTNSRFILSLPFEGSETLVNHCRQFDLAGYIQSGRLLLIGGGDMDSSWPHLRYDIFLTKFHDFQENLDEAQRAEATFSKLDKPYKFLFLNGRERPHRKFLIEKLDLMGLLDQSLWSYLSLVPAKNVHTTLIHNGVDLMLQHRPIKLLDNKYEVERYRDSVVSDDTKFVKSELFKNEWGDIYVNADCYIDTYFSLVTETVFDYPYSFRTEKIAKPLGMGHPFIVAANRGYYRDMHDLGFRSFGHLIDESFDMIDNNQSRLDRIAEVVADLCRQDLGQFLSAAKETCKYNQQHLEQLRPKIQQEFPQRFLKFLQQHE